MQSHKILIGDVREQLQSIPNNSVHCIVTSPPYWKVRKFLPDQHELGEEKTPEEFIENMLEICSELFRVLHTSGTFWLNMGDNYSGLKAKDLTGMPWRLALALQRAGWWLRSDIIWNKINCRQEPVMDRPSKTHEYLFLLTKSATYFYDTFALRETPTSSNAQSVWNINVSRERMDFCSNCNMLCKPLFKQTPITTLRECSNCKSTEHWVDHFAVFPRKLVENCIKTGTSSYGCCPGCHAPWMQIIAKTDNRHWTERSSQKSQKLQLLKTSKQRNEHGRDFAGNCRIPIGWKLSCKCRNNNDPVPCTVLDPFGGSGTTAVVAQSLNRNSIYIDCNAQYAALAKARLTTTPKK